MNEASESGRKLRVKERKTYIDQDLDDDEIDGRRSYKVEEKLISDKYNEDYVVQNLKGEDFNMKYLQENGLKYPILFKEKTGLGLRVPSDNFKVGDVKACVGSRRVLDVMDVNTQKGIEMTMKDWVKYYENTERDRLLNVISLEFSHTKLENYVESPNIVREVDWVDTAWPQHLKDCQTEATNAIDKMKYPKVQKYCLMSVQGCYTDFHIDFGGTSVWYHILHGEKIFWLIPPTPKNVSQYENWVLSGKQGDAFLADSIGECQRIQLIAGNTFIIPSGWIHAVYTPKDSLVFGGNFVHNFNMVNQLRVSAVEDRTHVPMKFRYPFFAEINWYVLERYVHSLTGVTYLEKPELNEDFEVVNTKSEKDPQGGESQEEKLIKRVSVALTRIDDSPRRKSTSDDDSIASGPARSPVQAPASRTGRKSSTESLNSTDGKPEKTEKLKVPYRSPVKKKMKYVHLTKWELEGLREIVGWVESLPSTKKGVPKDLIDPDAALMEVKRIIQEHINDNPELAITGEPVLEWTKATKKLIKIKQKAKTARLLGAMSAKGKGTGKNASGSRHRRVRCKKCEPCTRDDCMECNFCKDMKKYGGPGRAKQSCISRQCLRPMLPNNISCLICNYDKPLTSKHTELENEDAGLLMECGLCWEIVHPVCLNKKYENLNNEGVINEDLPNSWKCAKCCFDGKEGQLKTRVFKGGWRPNPTNTPPPLSEVDGNQSPKSPSLNMVTEGKRVTVNQASDIKPPIITKTAPSPRNTPSPVNGDVKIEEEIMTPEVKTEPPVISRDGSGKKSTEKIVAKRKHSPVAADPSKKARIGKQNKLLKSPKQLLSKSPKSEGDLTRKSRREDTLAIGATALYEFDDSEMMDAATRIPDRGKSKSNPKGKKLSHIRDLEPNFQLNPLLEQRPPEVQMQPRRFMTNEQIKQSLYEHINRKNPKIVVPKFVIRSAPCQQPEDYVYLNDGRSHCLPRLLWTRIFQYLSPGDLARCLAVCKVWGRWCINPDLWKRIDLTCKRIVPAHLMGVVRRQPEHLDLSSVIMTQKQLLWMIERLPLLKSLALSSCSWMAISGLCMSACPLLYSLDVSWVPALNDNCFEDLITPPVDRKPALKRISRLHRLKYLNLSGTEIRDDSLRMITVYLSRLERLNISYCTRITDEGIQSLTSFRSATQETLQVLNLAGCRQLTDLSLNALQNLSNLTSLDVSNCIRMTPEKCSELKLGSLVSYKW